jgi:hypothetical protein
MENFITSLFAEYWLDFGVSNAYYTRAFSGDVLTCSSWSLKANLLGIYF